MTKNELVEKIVVGLRSNMKLDTKLPKESYGNILVQAENLADEIKEYDPVAQEILITLCTRHGSASFQKGHPFEMFKAEALKMAEEYRGHVAAREKREREEQEAQHARIPRQFTPPAPTTGHS